MFFNCVLISLLIDTSYKLHFRSHRRCISKQYVFQRRIETENLTIIGFSFFLFTVFY